MRIKLQTTRPPGSPGALWIQHSQGQASSSRPLAPATPECRAPAESITTVSAEHRATRAVPGRLWDRQRVLWDQTRGCFCGNSHPDEALMSFERRAEALPRKRGGVLAERDKPGQTKQHPRLAEAARRYHFCPGQHD